ncbi:MAG: uroporphyrinogen decarboxylase family protein [Acidobacteria bacterium]|nr:uroporphyrinogen decarboxylase family protein [Acidobacteriota bacterium]
MRPEQWELYKKAAKLQPVEQIPVALIIDSPWIPGYLGMSHLDYYFDPEAWFRSNLRIMKEFPETIVFPSWWAEFGMAIEPSALGCKICFHKNQPPSQFRALFRLEDLDQLSPLDPYTDGLMPAALHRYQKQKSRIVEEGYEIRMATARGPVCTAAYLRGITELMLDIADNPGGVHKLMAFVTDGIIRWLKAQAEVIGPSVEGIFILDDIVGFLSPKHYVEFAHPYLKRIFESFPEAWVKVYHNDANIAPFLEDLAAAGFDVLNWSYKLDVGDARERTKGKICLMGNVPPLEIGTRGSPGDVKTSALNILRKTGGKGIILSLGGGVSPGMPRANMLALIEAAREFGRA